MAFCQHIFEGFHVINRRFGVGHADHGGESACGSGSGTGMNIFLIGKSRITEVHVNINESRSHHKTGGVDHPGIRVFFF